MEVATPPLKAPFPYFGGKSKVADIVWQRLGEVRNYVEPFCGSLAVLLNRPHEAKIETVNDANGFITNFWRAAKLDPVSVAEYADWPVNEMDLHARHRWLVFSEESREALARVKAEPEYFDAKVAGWWCWGACCWIGSGWCPEQLPHMDSVGRAILSPPDNLHQKRPVISSDGGEFGRGVHGEPQMQLGDGRPQLADAFARGRGVNGNDSAGKCEERRLWLVDWFQRLSDRLRPVRVCCGHWNRICDSPSTTTRLGVTGAFLDPPYRMTINGTKNRAGDLYDNDKRQDVDALCDEVQEWCLKWGDVPEMRIILCGLEGEYPQLEHWEKVEWKAAGGYGNQSGKVNENAARERLWISPGCVTPDEDRQLEMF